VICNNYNYSCVGIVDSVSPVEIKGFLLDNAPNNLSIIEGNLTLFPRINGYVVIPNETGWLVCMISWIGYNHSKDINEVNLPQGSRMIYLNTLGHIVRTIKDMTFERGVFSLPTVGDSILLPTLEQLNCIVKNTDENTITIGTSPLAGNQEIKISVDSLFGRHLAVLGNTGSGKSCTVSGLIRWSIEQSISKINNDEISPNFRAIILDPNGEYKNTFDDLNNKIEISRFSVMPSQEEKDNGVKQLNVPAWMWTSDEWASIVMASRGTQRPMLKEALRDLKNQKSDNAFLSSDKQKNQLLLQIEIYKFDIFLRSSKSNDSFCNKDKNNFGYELMSRKDNISTYLNNSEINSEHKQCITDLISKIDEIIKITFIEDTQNNGKYNRFTAFKIEQMTDINTKLNIVLSNFPKLDDNYLCNEDDLIPFNINNLSSYIESLAYDSTSFQYIQFMTMRINSLLNNTVISSVINNNSKESLAEWIEGFLSAKENKGKLCIIDLSLLPLDVIHLLVAVISRLIFESLQRFRKCYGNELPTLLVMEEAHTFIKRYTDNPDEFSSDKLSTKIFERIAREGRKFGLGMIVSSQRPSELSPTVLSQCNSYILHRIVNDKDQEMVKRLVPDNLGRLLDELPSLPQKKAIVLGAAVPIPTLVEINDLPENNRPKSDDPKFWDVWTGKEARSNNWEPIVDGWQKNFKEK